MNDYKPYQIEAVNRAITDHDYPRLTCFDHDGICCPCGEFHDKTREEWATHRAEAVLAAAGVTQPEPEYEYGPGYKEANGRWFSLDGAFTVREAAEHSLNNYADDQQVHLLRRVKAGEWEPVLRRHTLLRECLT